MDSFRTRPGGAIAQRAGLAVPLFAIACTAALKLPRELGNCVPENDASCTTPLPGTGSMSPPEAGAQSAIDAGAGIVESEGGSCGAADTLITFPCAPCVIRFCCMADSICSRDDACLGLVNCAVNRAACAALTPASATAFDDLQSCYSLNCPQQCQSLATHDF